MKTVIYYFSATGNSLAMARKIATGLGESELISIPQVLDQVIEISAERIGLVFPVYAWGLPRIMVDFMKRLHLHKEQYIFAVATCGAIPGAALVQLAKLIRKNGGKLAAGFAVKDAAYALLGGSNPLMKIMKRISRSISRTSDERLAEILATIKNNQRHRPEADSWTVNVIANCFNGLALKVFKAADKDFWVNDDCSNCHTCVRICPRSNIEIFDQRPSWKHNCELCFACVQWCPKQAIQYQTGSVGKPRSHHRDVVVNDMVLR